MKITTVIECSPDDLRLMLAEAVAPLIERIAVLENQIGHAKHAYTVNEVAEKISFSDDSVRNFIKKGRMSRKGLVYLRAHEVMPNHYRITPADLDAFIRCF